jgi:hypothetical protein
MSRVKKGDDTCVRTHLRELQGQTTRTVLANSNHGFSSRLLIVEDDPTYSGPLQFLVRSKDDIEDSLFGFSGGGTVSDTNDQQGLLQGVLPGWSQKHRSNDLLVQGGSEGGKTCTVSERGILSL